MERRIVAQLQTCMDSLNSKEMKEKPVMIIGATNRPDALDSALRRAGRFDREICLGIPDEAARCSILKLLTKRMKIDGEIDFDALAAQTPGYVGADLSALTYPFFVIIILKVIPLYEQKKLLLLLLIVFSMTYLYNQSNQK